VETEKVAHPVSLGSILLAAIRHGKVPLASVTETVISRNGSRTCRVIGMA
jgi:hypothetical protein